MQIESVNSRRNSDDKHGEKRAIPRFASFKPKTNLEVQNQETSVSENIHGPDKSRSKPQKPTFGKHRPRRHREQSSNRDLHPRIQSESTTRDPEPRESASEVFIVDRVGDFDNLKFGALHRYATPSYFRSGAGNVVGLPQNQRIDRAASTEKGLVLSDNTHGLLKNRDRHARWRLDQEGARELKINPREEHDPTIDSAADYVSLDTAQRAKRRRRNDEIPGSGMSSSDEHDTHYRSVEGKAKFKDEPADQDLRYNSDISSSQDIAGSRLTIDDSAQKKRVQLSERIDADPTNFEAWIDLISHQDNMLGVGQDVKRKAPTNAERRSNAEIRLSIFRQALEKVKHRPPSSIEQRDIALPSSVEQSDVAHPSSVERRDIAQGREVLLLGMMQEATKIWKTDKILSYWKIILQQNPHSLRLLTKYLDFMQTSFTSFRFEEVQSAYLDCLKMTRNARTSGEISVDEQDKIFGVQIYIVLRMSLFMRESGFAEHATAAWQALLEFVFFKPTIVQASDYDNNRSSAEAIVTMFEKFWDSEVPRIGEEGAQGWASFSHKQWKPPQPRTETADDQKDSNGHWDSWLASERRHTLLSRNPARTTDDMEESDPYRIVLFADIRPFLIDPPSVAGQGLVLDAFIAFCCLPPLAAQGPDSHSRIWGRDGFLRNDALRWSSKLQDSWKLRFARHYGSSEQRDIVDEENFGLSSGTQDPFQFPVRDYQVSSDLLFAEKQWFSAFDSWQEQCSKDLGSVDVAWALRSLKLLVSIGVGEEAVALYVLGLELRTSPGTVEKTARNILRKRPLSIRLYNAYALIEYRLANTEKGEGIITTSINMGKKLEEVSQRDTILLWRTWIWETLSSNSAQEALVRILKIGDEEVQIPIPKLNPPEFSISAKPALLLRTERAFVAIREHMLSLSSYSQATCAIECLMLFAYLKNAQSLSAATSAFKSNIALLSTHVSATSSDHEYLHQSFARLLYYHATHTHMFRPSDIRSLLAEAIAQFPQNTIFLALYAWNEARFRIDDRLRAVVKDLIVCASGETENATQANVIPHFFAIYSELHRAVTFGSNVSTIRSTFERAVESDSGAHCAGLWKWYFLFEHSRHEAERAKRVFWRALRACPWAKDLYMLAFEYLRGEKVMDEADLRGIHGLLGEKELRVHVALEDIFEGLDR